MTPPGTIAGRAPAGTTVPRRRSGPAAATRPAPSRGARPARPAAGPAARTSRPAPGRQSGPARIARGILDAPLLDRLVRGSGWIPLVAVGLMGIVFMQVSMLKLNTGVGNAVASAATLERQNAELRNQVSALESNERIEGVARRMGMVVPAAGSFRYVTARPGHTDAREAARGITAPAPVEPGSVVTAQQQQAAAAQGTAPATTTTTPPAAQAAPAPAAQTTTPPPAATPAPAPAPTPAPAPAPAAAATGGTGATAAPTTPEAPAQG